MGVAAPSLVVEHEMLAAGARRIIGIDEVGRGALAGPVAVGVAVWDPGCADVPTGLRDSKLMSEAAREAMAPRVVDWVCASAVGTASAAEIDQYGITRCLALAALRALASLPEPEDSWRGSRLLLDGVHDWLSPALRVVAASADGLFAVEADPAGPPWPALDLVLAASPVSTRPKADRDCAAVAAASVLAKVSRDGQMRVLAEQVPAYGWASNKGYGSAEHLAAIAVHGAHVEHRRTWLRESIPHAQATATAG